MTSDGTSLHDNLLVPRAEALAWQGVSIPLREEWRPLRIEGQYRKGAITIGNMDGPVFQLRWLRPPEGYQAAKWIDKRCATAAGGQTSPDPPKPPGFEPVSWIRNLAIRQESEKTVWWGFEPNARVLVEILLTNLCDEETRRWFFRHALPKLTVQNNTEDCLWRIYSAHCVVPAGYNLQRKRLAAGDIALEFAADRGRKLLVRQVFPALLALQRRPYAGWLRDRVFKERRRLRRESQSARDDGLKMNWTGWKRVPFPLGFLLPHRCEAVIEHDENLDRLFIVESEWTHGTHAPPVDDILASMKRAS